MKSLVNPSIPTTWAVAVGIALTGLLFTSCTRPVTPPRNVVLISMDTVRADRMSAYGASRTTTPELSKLFAQAVRFDQAFSPSPWTLPAHAAMLTGLYPSSLSVEPEDHFFKLAPLLSTILRDHGYRTAAVTGGGVVSEHFGADRGFDRFAVGDIDQALQWIDGHAEESFFLFFHTYTAHIPYRDRRFVDEVDGGRLSRIYQGEKSEWFDMHLQICCKGLKLTAAERDFLLRLYDGGIAAVDEMVGRIVTFLAESELLDKTIVVVTSDHGEEFWDHSARAAYHGHSLYNELLRIPLIWYEEGLHSPGSVRHEPVSLVDIVPTLLSRLGLRSPTNLHGQDLSPLLEGMGWDIDRSLFGELVRHGPPRFSVLTSAGKLIWTSRPEIQQGEGARFPILVSERRELYLTGDSPELHNRWRDEPELGSDLEQRLRDHLDSAAVDGRHLPETPMDDETANRLRSLGYLD